jgi:hypothetical protein
MVIDANEDDSSWNFPIILRIPLGVYLPLRGDIGQDQGRPGDTYVITQVMRVHEGFPNEYFAAIALPADPFGNRLTNKI